MISRPDLAREGRRGRLLRLSIFLSVIVHVAVWLLAFGAYDMLEHLATHRASPAKHNDETVTLSTAVHFERRARAAAAHPSRAARVAVIPRHAAMREPSAPAPRPFPARKRQLAKLTPRAKPQPNLTSRPAPTTNVARGSSNTTISAVRLAQIQTDLAATIARDRARDNPLSNVARRANPASTLRRYALNVAGTHSTLRGAQGLCNPSRTWPAGGFIYFYVTCRTQRADGSVRDEVIPWPIRFRPNQVAYGPSGPAPPPGEIPLPLPGWKLRASQYVDPDVLDFLRERRAAPGNGAEGRP